MKLIIITILCLFIPTCIFADKNISRKVENKDLERMKLDMDINYLSVNSKYRKLTSQIKKTNPNKYNQILIEFKNMKKTKNVFNVGYRRLMRNINKSKNPLKKLQELEINYNKYIQSKLTFNKIYNTLNLAPTKLSSINKREELINKRVEALRQRRQNIQNNKAINHNRKEKVNEKYEKKVLTNIKEKINTTHKDFESLVTLSKINISKSKYIGNKRTKQELEEMISNKINENIVSSSKDFANKQRSINDITIKLLLTIERGRYTSLLKYTSSKNIHLVNDIFKKRKLEIIKTILIQENIQVEKLTNDKKSLSQKAKNFVLYSKSFDINYNSIINEKEIKEYLNTLKQKRIQLLYKIEPTIISSIKSAKNLTSVKNITSNFLYIKDKDTKFYKKIKKVEIKKIESLTAFKPVLNTNNLSIGTFTTKNLNYEAELMAIYLGDFKNSRLRPNGTAINVLFEKYIENYSKYCHEYLPSNKVPITRSKCSREQTTRNGYGTIISTSCVSWVEVPTGLYANPILYNSSKKLSNTLGKNILKQTLFSKDPFASRAILDDALSVGSDMKNLIINNKCNSAGLKRFERNLYNFVENKKPLLLPNKETLAMVRQSNKANFKSDNLNLKKLIDDLITENSKTWMMNRYKKSSVSNIKVKARSKSGSPLKIIANYRFNSAGKIYRANVSLIFQNNLPKCLYFSDAPQTCRHPSRKINNNYEKGLYLK